MSSTRRGFARALGALFPVAGLMAAGLTPRVSAAAADGQKGIKKLDYTGQADKSRAFITPLIVHESLIYVSGQGAHSRDESAGRGEPATIDLHARLVMENVKVAVEAGGGTMDSILQLTVFLTDMDHYDPFNQVFKSYFPNGGPARTCVAVAALPGKSLVEVNCVAAAMRPAKRVVE